MVCLQCNPAVAWTRRITPAALVLLCTAAATAAEIADEVSSATAHVSASEQVNRDLALADARAALGAVDEMLVTGRAAIAADRCQAARARLTLISDVEVEALTQRLEVAEKRCRAADQVAGAQQIGVDRTAAFVRAAETRGGNVAFERDIFRERVARIRGVSERGHLELALARARRLVSDYPYEPEAEKFFNEILDRTHEQRRLTVAERQKELGQEVNERIERAMLPTCFDGEPVYPSDWHQRAAGRDQLVYEDARVSEWEEKLRARLAERITVDYNQIIPNELFQDLATRTSLNLVLDPSVVVLDKPISLKASNITLGNVLSWASQLVGTTWQIARGAIFIGGDIDAEPVTDYYDISALLFRGKDQAGRQLGLKPAMGTGVGGGGGGNPLGGLFQAEAVADTPPPTIDAMVDNISKAISPKTWTRPDCRVYARGNTLMVTAPSRVHKLLRQYLRARADIMTVQVYVEMRWLTLDDGYLEEIGVSWGAGEYGKNPVGKATATSDGLRHAGDQHITTASTTNQMPSSMSTGSSSMVLADTGMRLSTAVLKTLQLNAVVSAVERQTRGQVIHAPSITTFNGVRSNCYFGREIAYIGGYQVQNYEYDPQISRLAYGTMLDVKPFVSSDGKYVQMDIVAQLAEIELFNEIIRYQRPISYYSNSYYGFNNGLGNSSNFTNMTSVPLELPQMRIQLAATTSTIPDRGSLLIGGFGRHSDQSGSTKIPFLGHVPFLGRLFGMRGRYSDRRQLYLLATVHVINYQESEATL